MRAKSDKTAGRAASEPSVQSKAPKKNGRRQRAAPAVLTVPLTAHSECPWGLNVIDGPTLGGENPDILRGRCG